MREHFHNLQALRGIACLMVVLCHLQSIEKLFGVQTPLFREIQWFGFAGVDLFFVLSGFLITSTNLKHLGRPAAVPTFLFRRVWRIYPMYWAVLSTCALIHWVPNREFVAPIQPYLEWWPYWVTLAPAPYVGMNIFVGQAWTLTYEVMFYVAFGLVMCLPPRLGRVAAATWAAAVCATLLGPEPTGAIMRHVVSPFVFEFFGGCLIAWLAARGTDRWGRSAMALGLIYVVTGMLLTHALAEGAWEDIMFSQRTRVLVYGPAAVLFVYGMVALEGRWPRPVPRWLLAIGDSSYSLYLLHPTVFLFGMYVGCLVPHSRLPHLLWLAGQFAACLAVGMLAYRFVEKPLLNLARRKKAKPRIPAITDEAPDESLKIAA